jgi:methionine-rich copper-binding protein CopC
VLRRFLVVLVAAVVLAGLRGVAPAGAHVELESAAPAAGAVLTTPPSSLSLTFSTTPVTVGVEVAGPDGDAVAVGELARQGATVVVPLPPLVEAGTYTVTWRAANDAHPFTGSYTVTLDLPTTTTTAPSTTTTSGVAATDSLPASTGGASSDGGGTSTPLVVGLAAAVVAAAVAIVLVARARGRAGRVAA